MVQVVHAVGGKVPVLFYGGVRGGTDALKALAFGAKAVLVFSSCSNESSFVLNCIGKNAHGLVNLIMDLRHRDIHTTIWNV